MRRSSLNDGWSVRAKTNSFAEMISVPGSEPEPVTLPHDALIGAERSPPGNAATGISPRGPGRTRRPRVPAEDAAAPSPEFKGVYRDAFVHVNDSLVAHRRAGIRTSPSSGPPGAFRKPTRRGSRPTAHDDSRWYSGAGIYRSVWLLQAGRVHLVPGSLQVLTPRSTTTWPRWWSRRGAEPVHGALGRRAPRRDARRRRLGRRRGRSNGHDGAGDVLTARQRLCVPAPRRWGPDDPTSTAAGSPWWRRDR